MEREQTTKKGYSIKSPNCGRDEKGVFHCMCGKCEPLPAEIGEDRDDLYHTYEKRTRIGGESYATGKRTLS